MKNLDVVYKEEIEFLQFFVNSIFNELDFETIDYNVDSVNNVHIKNLNKKINDNLEIICKEKIYKKWIEKSVELKILKGLDYNKSFKVIINSERIKIINFECQGKKEKTISKQFGLNGNIIYNFKDNDNNYIMTQNVGNSLLYLEDFSDRNNGNIFRFDDEQVEYIAKYPYKFIYKLLIDLNKDDINNINEELKKENKLRESIGLKKYDIQKNLKFELNEEIEKVKFVFENCKNICDDMLNELLQLPGFVDIFNINEDINIVESNGEAEKNNVEEQEEIIYEKNYDSLTLEELKNKRNELLKLKSMTEEIIVNLQNILLS